MKKAVLFLFLTVTVFVSGQTIDVIYDSEDFETGSLGSADIIWSASGAASLSTTYSRSGSKSVELAGRNFPKLTTSDLGRSDVYGMKIEFWAFGVGMNGNDQVQLEYSFDGGSNWTLYQGYIPGTSGFFSATTPMLTLTSGGTWPSNTQWRFEAVQGKNDEIYIDDVIITIQLLDNPPTAPGALTAYNINSNSFNVSWGASSDEAAVTYNVYKDGVLDGSTSSTTYSFSSLAAETTYTIAVEAVDSSSQTSSQTSLDVTTSKASIGGSRFEGGTLTVGAGVSFTTTNMSVDGGNIVVNSNSTNSGSFIAKGTVTSSVSNAFTYNRYIPDSNGRIITIPVSGQGVTAFVDNSANSLNTFGSFAALGMHMYQRAFGQRWEYYNPNSPGIFDSDFNVAKGYAVMRTQAGNMTFTGDFPTLSSNQISFNVEAFVGSNLQKWRSIGNPYMSYFPGTNTSASVDTFLKLNGSKLDDNYQALYLWDGSQWVIVNNLSNYSIAPGQGFLVKLKDFTATSLDFPQSYQTHQTSEVFYDRETERSKISLYVEKNKRVAKTEIYYIPSGTQGLDPGYDAAAYSTSKLDIQTRLIEESEDLNYAIQAISSFNYDEQVVPLSLTSQEDQKLTFSVEHESIPSEFQIYLEDRENNKFYNLKESSAVLKVSQGTNKYGRFYIHTKPFEFWVEDNTEEDDNQDDSVFDLADGMASKAFDFFNLKDNILYFEGVNSKEQVKVNLFNLNGYKVFDTIKDIDTSNNAIQLPYTLSEGVYIIELYRASGKKMTKKIIVR